MQNSQSQLTSNKPVSKSKLKRSFILIEFSDLMAGPTVGERFGTIPCPILRSKVLLPEVWPLRQAGIVIRMMFSKTITAVRTISVWESRNLKQNQMSPSLILLCTTVAASFYFS